MEDSDLSQETGRQIYAEQIALLYRNAPLAYSITVINGSILAFVQRVHISTTVLLAWFTCLLLITLGRAILAYGYTRSHPSAADIRRWGLGYLIGAGLAGIAWGSTAIFLFPVDAIGHQVFVAFVLAGMSAGAVSVLSARLEAALVFLLPALLPLAVQFFFQQDELSIAMAAMTLLFIVGILIAAWNIHYSILRALRLKLDKQDLLTRLEKDKTRLLTEIVERKRAEEQAQRQQAELAHMARLSLAGEMAAGLAHELNQPLAAIMTLAEGCLLLIELQPDNREELSKILHQIVTQDHRAGEIIRHLKNFTRKTPPQQVPVNLHQIIREVAPFIETEARQRAVAVQFQLTEPILPVLADPIQIQQVVLNLASNAIEAMETMETMETGRRELIIQTLPGGGNTIEVAVCDAGPGLSREIADQLFQPFFTTKPKGMGLGLSISKSIIEAYGGRLWVTPNTGHGVTFHFTLPISRDRNACKSDIENIHSG